MGSSSYASDAIGALPYAHREVMGIQRVSIIDEYTTPAVKVLTGNNTTIYAGIFLDLGRDGPIVIDSPKGVYGVIDDFWQRPVVEVGPFGPDKATEESSCCPTNPVLSSEDDQRSRRRRRLAGRGSQGEVCCGACSAFPEPPLKRGGAGGLAGLGR
jgi:hypothetical protein